MYILTIINFLSILGYTTFFFAITGLAVYGIVQIIKYLIRYKIDYENQLHNQNSEDKDN